MFRYTSAQLSESLGIILHGKGQYAIDNVVFDSRSAFISSSSLFVALKGENRDGHAFLRNMYDRGVRVFLVQYVPAAELNYCAQADFLIVDSVIASFQAIAGLYRASLSSTFVGITGSNGKTVVKEWIHFLLSKKESVFKSPKSYNSQLGVPLSVCLIKGTEKTALVEAGISQKGEMQNIANIIKPQIGVFTYLGDAHNEGFESIEHKVKEKVLLFSTAQKVVYNADNSVVRQMFAAYCTAQGIVWSFTDKTANVYVSDVDKKGGITHIQCVRNGNKSMFTIPFADDASIYNACTVFTFLSEYISDYQSLLPFFTDLPSIEMRLHLLPAMNNCLLIDDSYSSDKESLKIAADFLVQQTRYEKRSVILSDINLHGFNNLETLYEEVACILRSCNLHRVIGVGSDIAILKDKLNCSFIHFESVDDFLVKRIELEFESETVLVKGARRFAFERIVSAMELQSHQTVLEINMNALEHNLKYFRSLLKPQTKVMVMVKAFSYGSGSYEIANLLQHQRVDYLAVAFADEGIVLRKAGITLPIVVMNPALEDFSKLVRFNLEPEIYSFRVLHRFIETLKVQAVSHYPIHVKVDTGMTRMGFAIAEMSDFKSILAAQEYVRVASVFSHLSGSDESVFDDFTTLQIDRFVSVKDIFDDLYQQPVIKHILNSAGIERFPHAQFSMVRLGIGIYGVSALFPKKLMHVGRLKTTISQLREVVEGTSVGYSRKGVASKKTTIAVLPIGYADGLRRAFSNGVGGVVVKGVYAPFIGNICMDACMADVTGIDVKEGDEAVVFGEELPISLLAEKIHTIAYEILTNVSARVKRVYVKE